MENNKWFVAALIILVGAATHTQDKNKGDSVTPEVEKAIQKGLEWLDQYDIQKYYSKSESGVRGGAWSLPEIQSFILMAFMLNGYGPDDPKYGQKIKQGIEYVMQKHRAWPDDDTGDSSFLLGLGTMALTQAYQDTKDEELRKKIRTWVEGSVQRMLKRQEENKGGGWGYGGRRWSMNVCMSFVSCWYIQALWGARQIGVDVPDVSFERAANAFLILFHEGKGGRGNFLYTVMSSKPEAKPREVKQKWSEERPKCDGDKIANNAGGALGCAYCGLAKSDQADRTIRHVIEHTNLDDYPMWISSLSLDSHFTRCLGLYNAMQTMVVYKDKYDWKTWRAEIEKQVIALQHPDGSFNLDPPHKKTLGSEEQYQQKEKERKKRMLPLETAVAVAALSVPKGKARWLEGIPYQPNKK